MRHALRHMNALEDYLNTGAVPRKGCADIIQLCPDCMKCFSVIILGFVRSSITPIRGLALLEVPYASFCWQ